MTLAIAPPCSYSRDALDLEPTEAIDRPVETLEITAAPPDVQPATDPATFVLVSSNGDEIAEPGKTLDQILADLKTEYRQAVEDGTAADGFGDLTIWCERRQLVATVTFHKVEGVPAVQQITRLRSSAPADEQPADAEFVLAPERPGPLWTMAWVDDGMVIEHPLKTSECSLDSILDAVRVGYEADRHLCLDSEFLDCSLFDPAGRLAASVVYPRTRDGSLRIIRFDNPA